MDEVAETLVAAFCRAAGVGRRQLEPPVDVYELARRIGAETVEEPSLQEDGRVEDGHRTTIILLRGGNKESRSRFTLAHELGHLVLANPDVLQLARDALEVERFDVERMCNVFAAELLMPRWWVRDRFADRQERLAAIDDLASSSEVSFSAAATRLMAVLRWKSTVIYFQRRHDWAPIVIAGGSRHQKSVALTVHTPPVLRSVPIGASQPVVRAIDLRVGRTSLETRAELRATDAGVFCLTRFRPVRPTALPRPNERSKEDTTLG
jgi:hypothetical protein